MSRAIDGDELLGIERLLNTDVVRAISALAQNT